MALRGQGRNRAPFHHQPDSAANCWPDEDFMSESESEDEQENVPKHQAPLPPPPRMNRPPQPGMFRPPPPVPPGGAKPGNFQASACDRPIKPPINLPKPKLPIPDQGGTSMCVPPPRGGRGERDISPQPPSRRQSANEDRVPVAIVPPRNHGDTSIRPAPPPVTNRPNYDNKDRSAPQPDSPESGEEDEYCECTTTPNLDIYKWFSPTMDRKQAQKLVTKHGIDGGFIVRIAGRKSTEYPYSLTIFFEDKTYNINLRQRSDGRYAIGKEKPNEDSFDTVPHLIEHYSTKSKIQLSPAGGNGIAGETLLKDANQD